MKRTGWLVVVVALSLAFAACSSSGSGGSGDNGLGGSTSSPSSTGKDVCTGKTLTSSEVGVSPSTITVTVMADVGSQLSPGLFQGSMDGVNAWAKYVNANGGLACRQVVVKEADSDLSPTETKNGVVSACGNSLVLLGTTALFLNDMRPAEGCKDKAGAATGIPDLAVLQTEPVEQCSAISFAVIPNGGSCPYSGSGVRTFSAVTPAIDWFKKNVTSDLHGIFVVPADLPSTITSSTVLYAGITQNGVKMDAEFGMSGLATQSQYTPIASSIKAHHATWVMNGLDYSGTLKMRNEAAQQGVTGVKVWACSLQCYAPNFVKQGGANVEGQYSWLQFLPFEDKGSNDTLDAFLQYDAKPDGFGLQAFAAGVLFQQVVTKIAQDDGPNAITRKAVLDGIRQVHDFDAGGMLVPTDVAGKTPSKCIVIVQVKNGAWTRVDPVAKGKFDCDEPSAITTISADPLKLYKPNSH
ncbi:MAG TPA: ABC transporter substrate-binding protein [Acidimicrobiia bacterium]|nr:ABC transporter substrate-binding protein [Acidimicrobiia bacterium]